MAWENQTYDHITVHEERRRASIDNSVRFSPETFRCYCSLSCVYEVYVMSAFNRVAFLPCESWKRIYIPSRIQRGMCRWGRERTHQKRYFNRFQINFVFTQTARSLTHSHTEWIPHSRTHTSKWWPNERNENNKWWLCIRNFRLIL